MVVTRKFSGAHLGVCATLGLMILAPPTPALAIEAGINVDIHQDVPMTAPLPNGFLMFGRLTSGLPLGMPGGGGWGQPPILVDHVDGYMPNVFPQFQYSIDPDPSDPNENGYMFWCLWSDPLSAGIPFCRTYHVGVLFDQTCHNVVIDVSGSWALNGSPIGIGVNQGWVPIPGFQVREEETPQVLHLRNGNANGLAEPGEIETRIVQMDLVVIPSREDLEMLLGPEPFRELWEGGAQAELPWQPLFYGTEPISEINPYDFWPDSFFDVFFDGSSPVRPLEPVEVPIGGFLLVRERQLFWNNAGETDYRWTWEFHQAHEADLGDAPDSTNSFGLAMTAYPPGGPIGVPANFPSVYLMGSPPHGPIHFLPGTAAWLGQSVSLEDEADIGPDQDGINNLVPPNNWCDLDMLDDGVAIPLALPHCQPTSFSFTVTTGPAPVDPMYVNVWFDWMRNGDWDDTPTCPDTTLAPEWAVQNMVLNGLMPFTAYIFTTPTFLPWHPSGSTQPEPIWMRITISEKPWSAISPQPGYGGSGPPEGYRYGETEDYFFTPEISQTEACCFPGGNCQDLDPQTCENMEGWPQGPGSVCAGYTEACCAPSTTGVGMDCYNADPICCDDLGGVTQGPFTQCTTLEACCLQDGSCVMVDPVCCDDMGGTPQGTGTQCTQTEACCIPSEVEPSGMICRQLDPLCCDDLGGTTQGPGTACQFGTEACCIPSDTDPLSITCTDVDPLCCDELGGTPQGPGTACVDMTIACCLTDGTCTDVDPVCCDDLGGVPSPYGEPHCLGDTNDNGIDDACEDTWYWKDYNGDLPDGYMPDYDQNQDFNGDGAVDLNYCGPTAVANSIWWFHRKFPDEGVVPNSWTVLDLVQNLAWRMATNGQSPSPNGHVAPYAGTFWDDMQSGIDAYLQAQGADDLLYEHTEPQPTFDYIADEVERSQDVVLLVGFYHIEWVEQTGEDMWTVHWVRRGGHYLTVAGVDRVKKRLALSDTDADAAEHGSSGVVRPAGVDHNHDGDNDPTTALPFRDPGYDHSVHNSETYASHDFHGVRPSFSPGGVMALTLEGDPLAYGTRMQNYHWGDAGGTYDAGTTTVTLVFLQEHGYPIPEYCQTYTEVEYAVVVSPFDTCEPTSDGQGCEPATCPVATEQCLPKKVNYDPTNGMVIVTECECIDPSYCHVNWDLQPFCMGGCPLNEECVSVETPLPNGTVDFECQCVPPPPPEAKWSQLPHPEGEGFDAASDLWWPQIFKVIQPPDPNWSGLHSHDWADASGEYYWTRIADDWLCEGGVVTDLHWWGNYENNDRRSGIDHFHLSIHICASWPPGPWCVPGEPPMWETDVPMTMITETDTGLVNNMGETIYLYKFDLPDPFPQLTGTYYWLDVQAVAVDPLAAPIWRWQEARRDVAPPLQHAPAASRTESTIWQSVIWPAIPPETPERYSDMAFAVTSVVEPAQQVNKVVADDFKSDGRRIEGLRWWGSYFDERYAPGPTIDPTHVLDGWLISFHYDEPDRVCPPDVSATITPNVLGVYFAPPEAVTIVSLGVSDCFGHGIYEYVVNLRQCCLICSAPDPRIPNGTYPAQPEAFFETHGFIYWLDIQAVTGAKWVPTAVEPGCELRLTGHLPSDLTSDGHFWGWHTSPDHWREEACTGRIVDFSPYPPNCWIYGDWVKQPWLCGTMPPFPPVDMAFELLTPEKRGDCTGDGVVDLADYLVFESCLAGPNAGLGAGCECADLDVDMDVDLVDFAIFQIVFEG